MQLIKKVSECFFLNLFGNLLAIRSRGPMRRKPRNWSQPFLACNNPVKAPVMTHVKMKRVLSRVFSILIPLPNQGVLTFIHLGPLGRIHLSKVLRYDKWSIVWGGGVCRAPPDLADSLYARSTQAYLWDFMGVLTFHTCGAYGAYISTFLKCWDVMNVLTLIITLRTSFEYFSEVF